MNPILFIDGVWHGKWVAVDPKKYYFCVQKPRPRLSVEKMRIDHYDRKRFLFQPRRRKDGIPHKTVEFEAFVLNGMSEKDAARELMYVLLRRPAKKPQA